MIKPYAITREQTKSFLSIANTTYDDKIDLYLPVVTNDLFRTNGICNQSFLIEGTCDTNTSNTLTNVQISSKEWDCLEFGATVLVSGEDHVIADSDKDAKTITLESATTSTAENETLKIRNFPYGAKSTVSKMIVFKFTDGTVNTNMGREASSESIGSVSITYNTIDSSNLDSRFGYPASLCADLATVRKPRLF